MIKTNLAERVLADMGSPLADQKLRRNRHPSSEVMRKDSRMAIW
jgi:hypothetical protein